MNGNANLVKFEGLPQEGTYHVDDAVVQRFKQFLYNPGALEFLMRCMDQYPQLQQRCITLTETCSTLKQRCDYLESLCELTMCPGEKLYSQRTLDEYSDDGKVTLNQVVQDVGPGFVNAFPVPPGQSIRLTHRPRPGYLPHKIGIDANFAGGANNYLDLDIQFYLIPGGVSSGFGLEVGSLMTGNEFLNKDGTQIRIPWFEYRGCPMDVGSLEFLAVNIKNNSAASNLESVQVNIYYNNRLFYELCKKRCGCAPTTSTGACPTG